MTTDESEIEELVEQARLGEPAARAQLLAIGRTWLRSLVAGRLDRRLAGRLEDSDLVQDVLLLAERKLDDYLRDPTVPFLCWLRTHAEAQLVDTHRRHVIAQRRSVLREQTSTPPQAASELELNQLPADSQPTASQHALRAETIELARAALERLAEPDRVVLVLHFLEQVDVAQIARLLGLTESGVRSRLLRALQRLRLALNDNR